jgi:hypothetical protein
MSGSGPWLARKLGRTKLFVAEVLAAAHLAIATAGLRYFTHLYPGLWWPAFGLIALVALQIASKGQAEQDRRDKQAAEDAAKAAKQDVRTIELEALLRYKRDTAGNLARLLKTLHERTNHTRTLQAAFLSHAVDVVKDYLGLDRRDDQLSATWVIPVDGYTQWQTVAYDRNQIGREAGRKRPIAPEIPGAAEAFLMGNDVFIDDTMEQKIAHHFDRRPMYRGILSLPARTRNVTRGANVTIDGHQNAIVGVLNIDCKATGILRADVARVVGDIAYLIGVLELINQGLGGGPNG